MTIKIDDLAQITLLLLSKFKESKGNEIEIQHDYFWEIADEELYNPLKDPRAITIGQLSYDIERIKCILHRKNDDIIPYHLHLLSNILKAISIENPIAF
jgi:hypothetical protein